MEKKKFNLFGSKYTIEYVDEIETEDENVFRFGQTNSAGQKILIAKNNYWGKPMSKDDMKLTLLHELIHAVLAEGQYGNVSDDEPLVEWLARCIKSLIDQKII